MKQISKSANCKTSPEVTCARILSEEGLMAWWVGKIKIVDKDISWPALNSKMSWSVMGNSIFKARVVKDNRPSELIMEVETPSADSLITHTFDLLPDGGTRYTKTVEPKPRSKIMGQIIIPLLLFMLHFMVKKEVERAAAYADSV